MKKGKYYVNGIGLISPQRTFDNSEFLPQLDDYSNNILSCVTPDFKQYINPIPLRRMTRVQRMGLASAVIAMRDSGIEKPDGIITATGYGAAQSKAAFVEELLLQNEVQITPTHFVQSSYNGLAGLVAMTYGCMGYNSNCVSSGSALETALQDAMLQLLDNPSFNFLVGSYEESSEKLFDLDNRTGHFKKEPGSSLRLFERNTTGTIKGEGAAFFCLSAFPSAKTWCNVAEPLVIYKPTSVDELSAKVKSFLAERNMERESIDLFISGATGDSANDQLINQFSNSFFADKSQCRFKHLCGEYQTASSFAIWLGASMLKRNHVTDSVRSNQVEPPTNLKRVLIGNHYRNKNYSFILLEREDSE
jgi:3-oxoacyl-[acyl-carrier-protein] synthase II